MGTFQERLAEAIVEGTDVVTIRRGGNHHGGSGRGGRIELNQFFLARRGGSPGKNRPSKANRDGAIKTAKTNPRILGPCACLCSRGAEWGIRPVPSTPKSPCVEPLALTRNCAHARSTGLQPARPERAEARPARCAKPRERAYAVRSD